MKKTIRVASLMLLLAAAPAMSQMMGGGQMMGNQANPQMMQQQNNPQSTPYGMYPGMMGGYGHVMGPQMMGGYGYGMGPGMMGYNSPEQYEKQLKENQDFLNETKELRKKMHTLRFDYAEALRNPETNKKDLERLNAEMESILKQIYEKKHK